MGARGVVQRVGVEVELDAAQHGLLVQQAAVRLDHDGLVPHDIGRRRQLRLLRRLVVRPAVLLPGLKARLAHELVPVERVELPEAVGRLGGERVAHGEALEGDGLRGRGKKKKKKKKNQKKKKKKKKKRKDMKKMKKEEKETKEKKEKKEKNE